jgi:5-bromo-4-chloroindolyl phosphate hydrolysis protein
MDLGFGLSRSSPAPILGTSTVFMLIIDVSILIDPVLKNRCRRAVYLSIRYSKIDAGALFT